MKSENVSVTVVKCAVYFEIFSFRLRPLVVKKTRYWSRTFFSVRLVCKHFWVVSLFMALFIMTNWEWSAVISGCGYQTTIGISESFFSVIVSALLGQDEAYKNNVEILAWLLSFVLSCTFWSLERFCRVGFQFGRVDLVNVLAQWKHTSSKSFLSLFLCVWLIRVV